MWTDVFVGLVVVFALLFSATTKISPEDLTRTRFRVLESRVPQNVLQGQDVTNLIDIKSLPEVPGKDNATVDGWANPIMITVDGSKITLRSYGKDGKPGGADQNKDMEYQFSISSLSDTP